MTSNKIVQKKITTINYLILQVWETDQGWRNNIPVSRMRGLGMMLISIGWTRCRVQVLHQLHALFLIPLEVGIHHILAGIQDLRMTVAATTIRGKAVLKDLMFPLHCLLCRQHHLLLHHPQQFDDILPSHHIRLASHLYQTTSSLAVEMANSDR